MLLPIGATIRCCDGAAGRLKYVVIDPDDGEVTHLIVERGMLLRRDIVVPAAWVEQSSEHEIVLNATVEELNEQPEYREFDFIEPDPSYRPLSGYRVRDTRIWVSPYVTIDSGRPWLLRHVRLGIQGDELLLQRGMPVHTRDGRHVGALDHLVMEPKSLHVTHLVVRRGWLWNRQARIVPLERVAVLSEYGIRLDISAEAFEQLPVYQPPASDKQIAMDVQRALETDPRTREAGLRVDVHDGVVGFQGSAPKEVMEAARSIARRMRGFIGFADDVVAPPSPPLKIGAPVHARDGRYGTLHKVVVDPHARRVTHLVVRQGFLLTEDRVIPIERVERAEADGIYLDLRPEGRKDEPPLTRFKDMLRQAEQRIRPKQRSHALREQWADETGYLRDWLDSERLLQGRGMAVLSCQSIGLWRAYQLPVPVHNRLEVDDRPYLRPLATPLDEFERYLVVLIDAGTARLIEVRLGTAEELTDVQGYVPPATGNVVEKTGHKHDTYLRRHARHVVERTEETWREQGYDWLVIGGTEEALGELRDHLPKAMRQRLAGELRLSPEAELAHILDRVLEIEREQERRVEAQRVEELITTAHKSDAAALGLEATLLTIAEQRVRLLIVEEDFSQPGWECPNCRFIGVTKQVTCPLCGTALREHPDIAELALEHVLDQDGDIEVLRSPEARQALAQYGRIGALLRYAYTSPPTEEDELSDPQKAV